jgi:hypothetical protein
MRETASNFLPRQPRYPTLLIARSYVPRFRPDLILVGRNQIAIGFLTGWHPGIPDGEVGTFIHSSRRLFISC